MGLGVRMMLWFRSGL